MKITKALVCNLIWAGITLVLVATFSLAHADELPLIPDQTLTPGAVDPSVTEEMIANHTFNTGAIRNVPKSVIDEVYERYGLKRNQGYCNLSSEHCEVDHRVSCENGGICGLLRDANGKLINDPVRLALLISNLWPQIYEGPKESPPVIGCGARHKDALEDKLAKLVRSHTITLQEDQAVLLGDWIEGYKKYVDPKGCES